MWWVSTKTMRSERSPDGNAGAIAGFSLLESLVVVVIVGILAAIAAPGWLAFMNQQRLGRATEEVVQVLRKAQAEAKRTGTYREARFNFAVDPPQYAIVPVQTSYTPAFSLAPFATAQIRVWEPLGRGNIAVRTLRLTDNNPNGDSIMFSPKGEVVRTTLAPTNPTQLPYTVTISLYSRPAVKRCVRVESLLGAISQGSNTQCP